MSLRLPLRRAHGDGDLLTVLTVDYHRDRIPGLECWNVNLVDQALGLDLVRLAISRAYFKEQFYLRIDLVDGHSSAPDLQDGRVGLPAAFQNLRTPDFSPEEEPEAEENDS